MGTTVAFARAVKTVLILILTGALFGVVVTSLVVPPALSWYITPGGLPDGAQIQALVQIPELFATPPESSCARN